NYRIGDDCSDLEDVLTPAAPGKIVQKPADEGSDDRDCSSVGFLFHLLKEEISWLGDAIQIIVNIVVGYGQNSTIGTEPRGEINNPLAESEKCSDDALGYVERLG